MYSQWSPLPIRIGTSARRLFHAWWFVQATVWMLRRTWAGGQFQARLWLRSSDFRATTIEHHLRGPSKLLSCRWSFVHSHRVRKLRKRESANHCPGRTNQAEYLGRTFVDDRWERYMFDWRHRRRHLRRNASAKVTAVGLQYWRRAFSSLNKQRKFIWKKSRCDRLDLHTCTTRTCTLFQENIPSIIRTRRKNTWEQLLSCVERTKRTVN